MNPMHETSIIRARLEYHVYAKFRGNTCGVRIGTFKSERAAQRLGNWASERALDVWYNIRPRIVK